MKLFQVQIKETAGLARNTLIARYGVPFPQGLCFNHRELGVNTEQGALLASSISPTALWPDNSIKWCLVESLINIDSYETLNLSIEKQPQFFDYHSRPDDVVTETENSIEVKTKSCIFRLDKKQFNFIHNVTCDGKRAVESGYCILTTSEHEAVEAVITDYRHHTSYSQNYALSTEVTFDGAFRSPGGDLIARFQASCVFYTGNDLVQCSFMIRNTKPARHISGLWDLGDPNSIFFTSLDLGFTVRDLATIKWKTGKTQPWTALQQQPLVIYQESSGGRNWNSPNHKDRNNTVPYRLDGFECKSSGSVLESGKRASPCMSLNSRLGHIGVFVENFWQNCPKSIGIEHDRLNIGLFPREFPGDFELQPGEQKTHTFYLDFGNEPDAIGSSENPVEIALNPAWIEKTGVFHYFNTDITNDPLHGLIKEGLTGDNNFYAKREIIDEYGWRNFGDLYADHEAEASTGNEIFVSHYNNQYDPIYGFLRQFALTGDRRWFELANDLAAHVVDIDIYHTKHDKEEYNGGLFWHTDHYLEAATSTHRSFSRLQKSNAYIGHAGGGGPGGQHCYTTGLLYHYLLTGNEASRETVLQLTDWVTKVYEGSGTLLSVLLSVKNKNQAGSKNISTGKYPLDRGTGNYINALLDKFTLTQEQTILRQVEHIIQNTIHPLDDIAERNLDDAELSWFYTVFLQSLCRYLQTKEEIPSLDNAFYYARDSLLHYADWMVTHEYPYLEKPEILEFPNQTWTAQDLRKVNILLFARYYSPASLSTYSDKAEELYRYITGNLANNSSRSYTRILAILMQNHGAVAYFSNRGRDMEFGPVRTYQPPGKCSRLQAIKNIVAALLDAMKSFSPKKELRWLSHRSDTVASLLRIRS